MIGTDGWDVRLKRFLAANDRREAERALDQIHHDFLEKVIERTLSEEIGGDMPSTLDQVSEEADIFEDLSVLVRGRIAVRLLLLWERHRQEVTDNTSDRIGNLYGYAVSATRNACVDFLRQEYPGRHALDISLRSALGKGSGFALWDSTYPEGYVERLCGRSEWRDAGLPSKSLKTGSLAQTLSRELEGLSKKDALARLFEIVGHPIRFNELISFLSRCWDVERVYQLQAAEFAPFRVPKPYQHLQPDEVVETIGTLQSAWRQLRRLAPNQVAVLVLKAPPLDFGNFLDLLISLDIADLGELRSATGVSAEILQGLLSDLPIEDDRIAELIGVSLEAVPRIRQDARRRLKRQNERLLRRLKKNAE